MATPELDRLAKYFETFASVHAAPSSPLYEIFAAHVAASPDLLALAQKANPGQPPANLMFAAVHYLLRREDQPSALADYYASLGGSRAADAEAGPLFEAFIWDNERAVRQLMADGVTNTNEVGRCATLLPGFAQVAAEARAPLHLVEIGPSCCLNLVWDHYRYRYGDKVIGDEDCAFELAPTLRSPIPAGLLEAIPPVASRTGLELYPVNNDDPETLAWQLALIWPEHGDRARRIIEAFDRARRQPMRVIAGDAVETIEGVLHALPADGAVCIFHSFCMYQIPKARKEALSETLRNFGKTRPVWRLGYEWFEREDGSGSNELGIARYKDGNAAYQRYAFADPHGRWVDWQPAPALDHDII